MPTFEEQIEGITQIAIESTGTVPNQEQVNNYLNDGIKDIVNKIVRLNPMEAYKFATSSYDEDNSGITVTGQILSVTRENGSAADIRPATPIPHGLKYLATDKSSLHYRSAYNPAYYVSDKKLYVLPAPSSSTTRGIVSHIEYVTTVFSNSEINDFPNDYEDLVMLYASAQSCQAAATDIQNNMPNVPLPPSPPIFDIDDVELPELPILISPDDFSKSLVKVSTAIGSEDFDKADKQLDLLQKELDIYQKTVDIAQFEFSKELEVFKAKNENVVKDKDREFQVMAGEYGAEIQKFQNEVGLYSAEVQEKGLKYKWYMEQYFSLMKQYNEGVGLVAPPQEEKPKKGKGEG